MPRAQTALPLGGHFTPAAVRRLAAMRGASGPVIEAAVTTAPFAFRAQLFAQIPPLVTCGPPSVDGAAGTPTSIVLTDAGLEATEECADWVDAQSAASPPLVSGPYVPVRSRRLLVLAVGAVASVAALVARASRHA